MKMLQSYQQQQGIPCVHEESMLATGALAIAIGDKSGARAHPDAKDQSGSTNRIRNFGVTTCTLSRIWSVTSPARRLCTASHSSVRKAKTDATTIVTDKR